MSKARARITSHSSGLRDAQPLNSSVIAKMDLRMYESPKSELIDGFEIKQIGIIKILIMSFVVLGLIESFALIDIESITEFDIFFAVGYSGFSVLIAWLVWREIKFNPKKSFKLPGFIGLLFLFVAFLNLSDSDASMFFDTVIVALEAITMMAVAVLLKNGSKLN